MLEAEDVLSREVELIVDVHEVAADDLTPIFLELWTSLTNYELIGPREISNAPIIPALLFVGF